MSLNSQESSSVEGLCNRFAAFFKDVNVDDSDSDVTNGFSECVILGSVQLSWDAEWGVLGIKWKVFEIRPIYKSDCIVRLLGGQKWQKNLKYEGKNEEHLTLS